MMNQSESSYIGRHAELYDLFYSEKSYADEAKFVHKCLQKVSNGKARRILELACGTGNHAFQMEKLGYDVIATDYSKDMLVQANLKALKSGSKVIFRQEDMRDINVPERPFDAVMCLFDSIGYVGSNESIHAIFDNVSRHLCKGGCFIFEFWHAAAMIKSFEPVRIRRWRKTGREILRISETQMDILQQLCHVNYSIYELNDNGNYGYTRETQTNRYFLIQEMADFLAFSGLKPLKWFRGFSEIETIDETTWHIVALAQKQEN